MKYILFITTCFLSFLSFSQPPTANFSATPLVVCLGNQISFTDLSTPGGTPIVNWDWDFGDGNSSTQLNPTHTYSAPGTYTIILTVTGQNGQADPEVKVNYITVNPLPSVGFTASSNGCTVPFDATFTNTSVSGPNYTYSWNFGNGQSSVLKDPLPVTYGTPGTYTVTLTVTNTTTGCVNSFSNNVVVNDFTAEFDFPLEACVGSIVNPTDMSTLGVNAWSWNFGNFQTSTQQNPSVVYSSAGTYTISLTSQNTGIGCSDVVTHNIIIHDLPVPSFTSNVTTGCAPLDVNFSSTTPGGTNYEWNFGNGDTFTGEIPPTETYNSNGSYNVSLTMTDGNGCSGTITLNNYITVSPPVADFTVDISRGCDPLDVSFTDLSTSSDPINDPIITWQWNFGDGSPVFNGQNPPTHAYNVGIYSVSLTITTLNGCTESITKTDTIQVGSINTIDFSHTPTSDCAKSPFDFTDLTTFNGVPGPGEVTWQWDFGDGGMDTQQNPTYTYPVDTGYFDVTLIVNWRGCMDTIVKDSAVYIKAPISLFSPAQTLYCNAGNMPGFLPVNVVVNDNAIIGADSDDVEMIWKWGDGSPNTILDDIDLDGSNGTSNHNYTSYGTYTIEQVIYNHTTGCEDSTTATINISWTIADFTMSNDSTCVGSPISLTSTSTSFHPFGTYSYNMGNSATVSGSPVSYTYNTSGSYNITLTATNNVGCAASTTFVGMDVLALPIANIVPSDVSGCAPITVTYDNGSISTGNGVSLASFQWTMPDMSIENTSNVATSVNYTYNAEGNYTVSMIATDQFGCVSSPTSVGMSITKPNAAYTVEPIVCSGESFTTTNQSTGVATVTYEWFVDNNSQSTNTNFTSSFNDASSPSITNATHNVMLIATDGNGCKDTSIQVVTVSLPYANLNYVLDGANINNQGEFTCPPVFATFEDQSTSFGNITNWNWNFGDGKMSTLQNPSNTYVFAGTYTLQMTVIDEYGCVDDTVLVDYLTIGGPEATPVYTSGPDNCGQYNSFQMINDVDVAQVIWNLGDGTTYVDSTNFVYFYENPGTYNPTMTIEDALGCEVIYQLPTITVIESGLDALFTASPTIGPVGSSIVFDDQSTTTASPIFNWEWNFVDQILNASSGANQTHVFGLPGIYTINLLITDINGCTDDYSLQIKITDEFDIPNVITPNNDGTNDFFTLPFAVFESFDILIENRWGNVVHEATGQTGTLLWDGNNKNGVPCVDGTYFYLLKGVLVSGNEIAKQGTVSVFRGQ